MPLEFHAWNCPPFDFSRISVTVILINKTIIIIIITMIMIVVAITNIITITVII